MTLPHQHNIVILAPRILATSKPFEDIKTKRSYKCLLHCWHNLVIYNCVHLIVIILPKIESRG